MVFDVVRIQMDSENVRFSQKRNVILEINAIVGASEFQVKLDQEIQFDKSGKRSGVIINEKEDFDAENLCFGQPQVCTGYVINKSMDS